jgi:hypothetical protein
MLSREVVAVYCENSMNHINSIYGESRLFTVVQVLRTVTTVCYGIKIRLNVSHTIYLTISYGSDNNH